MQISIKRPSPLYIASDIHYRREPRRPIAARPANFAKLFDGDTLIYDHVFSSVKNEVFLLCPPLYNLESYIKTMQVIAWPSGASCKHRHDSLDRHSRIIVKVPLGTTSLAISSALGSAVIELHTNENNILQNRRVLLTLSKDNNLVWIQDWIRYHRDVHGADAVLIYDNGSETYNVQQLAEAINAINGIQSAIIVEWKYKYGPQGFGGRYWDSDFCQSGALENARWKFLQNAKSVLNLDIDELVLTENRSIFESVETTRSGYLPFHGLWVVDCETDAAFGEVPINGIKVHRHFAYILKPKLSLSKWHGLPLRPYFKNQCPTKWAAVPSLHPTTAQWQVHRIKGIITNSTLLRSEEYRHFRPINTNWKHGKQEHVMFQPQLHELDKALIERYKRVKWNA